jgi:hypothetical protein
MHTKDGARVNKIGAQLPGDKPDQFDYCPPRPKLHPRLQCARHDSDCMVDLYGRV